MNLPKINDTVLVLHTSNGNGKLVKRKRSLSFVSQVDRLYLGGEVGVGCDVFSVKPCGSSEADWETIQ